MKNRLWWAGAVAIYLLILVVFAPAAWLDVAANRLSEGRVRIAAAEGTFWSGRGELQLVDARRTTAIAEAIEWQIFPVAVLAGRIECAIGIGGARKFRVAATPSRLEIADADVSIAAAVLGVIDPAMAPFALRGRFVAHIVDLVWTRPQLHANGVIVWRAAGSEHSKVAPLGDYQLAVAPAGRGVQFRLTTLNGPLQLEGGGAWSPGARPVFNAIARAAPQFQEQIEPLLRLFAVERGGGNYEVRLQ